MPPISGGIFFDLFFDIGISCVIVNISDTRSINGFELHGQTFIFRFFLIL